MDNLNLDLFFNGKISCYQPKKGYKSGLDAVMLSSLVKAKKGDKILDIGSGVGIASLCLACRLALENIEDIQVFGLEKQEIFHQIALKNQQVNQLNIKTSKFFPILGNIIDYPDFNFKFDTIISNPPYYKNQAKNSNTQNTLSPKQMAKIESDADLAKFIKFAFNNLQNHKYLYLINRSERLQETLNLLNNKHWGNIEIFPLYTYAKKSAKLFMVKAKKLGALVSLLHYGIILHNEDSSYSPEAREILENAKPFPKFL
ncbi:putative tRNA methyltransferase [Candidatus Hepatincolaceae symbiont of Richtersius coronifer]